MAILSIIIPCYNEREGIPSMYTRFAAVIPELRQRTEVELVLVDDGSSDGSAELLETAFSRLGGVTVLRHTRNRGLGAALRTGFARAHGDIIVTCDSDGTYPFEEIPALIDRLIPGVDIVTASPYHPAGGIENVPAYRIFISKGASLCYRLLVGRHITPTRRSSGPTAVR